MSSNITRSDVAVRLGTTIDDADVTTFQSLTADTLNVIGTSQKGKAFVPQNIVNPGTQTRIKPDDTAEELEIYNTVDNILGGLRSTMTYIGAKEMKHIAKCTSFIRVNNQVNNIYHGKEV